MIKAGRKPVEIARYLKISESAVSQWFSKDTGPKSIRLADLAGFLNTTVDYLITEPAGTGAPPPPPVLPPRGALDRPDLAVYASAAGGPEGAWVLSSDAIAWIQRDQRLVGVRDAFACYVVGESMVPAYEQGNLLLVNPAVPPGAGDDCLFVQEADDGARYALIKRLVRFNSTSWTVKQWNPDKTFTLPRREWQKALLVIGKYNRG
ncbi:MAG: LexA family transcriptional regulator [Alphaproteobacteria bacterium]|nr:LexA family transcriptional regulator [Alphaproteobacteria bacterium]MBV8409929.1 LexA family transcriptional regulator [Alphaproteobacteria bacterium]